MRDQPWPHLKANEIKPAQSSEDWIPFVLEGAYAIAFVQLLALGQAHIGFIPFTGFLFIFALLAWSWAGSILYGQIALLNDGRHRLFLIIEVFLVLALAFSVRGAFTTTADGFSSAYFLLRSINFLFYMRLAREYFRLKQNIQPLLKGFAMGMGLWFISILVPLSIKFYVWGAAFLVEVGTLWMADLKWVEVKPQMLFLPLRSWIFTALLILSLIIVLLGRRDIDWNIGGFFSLLPGIGLLPAMTWFYNEFFSTYAFGKNQLLGKVYIFNHWFFMGGLLIFSLGITHSVMVGKYIAPAIVRTILSLGLLMVVIALVRTQTTGHSLEKMFHMGLPAFRLMAEVIVATMIGGILPHGVFIILLTTLFIFYVLKERTRFSIMKASASPDKEFL